MPAVDTVQRDGNVILKINGDFTFDMNREFRHAYQACPKSSTFVVDLANTRYMDSSGLGMLLQLRQYVGEDKKRVRIVKAQPRTAEILKVAQFDSLFDVGEH